MAYFMKKELLNLYLKYHKNYRYRIKSSSGPLLVNTGDISSDPGILYSPPALHAVNEYEIPGSGDMSLYSPPTVLISDNIHTNWRIWGGGHAGCTPPLWDPILSFLHTFSLKSAHVGGPRPLLTGACPPREILDPPLTL